MRGGEWIPALQKKMKKEFADIYIKDASMMKNKII